MFNKIFRKLRFIKREKINNAITFANIVIKIKYNIKYLAFTLKKSDEIFLKLYYNYFILSLINKKLL